MRPELIKPIGFESSIHADSIVFAVIGDYGKAGAPEKDVSILVKSWKPDFIITTGDNNYQSGELKTIEIAYCPTSIFSHYHIKNRTTNLFGGR